MRTILLLVSLVVSTSGVAREALLSDQVNKSKIDRLVSEYFAQQSSQRPMANIKSLMHANSTHEQNCEDQEDEQGSNTSCRDVACDFLGQFGCDDLSELQAVGEACRGNRNSACLEAACTRLGQFGCDDLSEVRTVAQVCKGHPGRRCLNVSCDLLGQFGCDDLSEIRTVGEFCRGTPSRCVESTCARLGQFGCDDLSEVKAVAESCKGN